MLKRTELGDSFTSIVVQGLILSGLLEQVGDELTKGQSQSAARWKVLASIEQEDKTVAEIARGLNLSRQGIQRIADALTESKLTRFAKNPSDLRADLLCLTEKGRKTLSAIQLEQRQWANQLGNRLGKSKLIKIESALEDLISVLSQIGIDDERK